MKTFELVGISLEKPYTSAEYYTDKGFLKFDLHTRTFYDNDGSSVQVEYWFKEIKTFEQVSELCIKYMATNHHPHTKMIVESDRAELPEGIKSNMNTSYIQD